MVRASSARTLLAAWACFGASACHEPLTQLVVVVDSDLAAARVAQVRIQVEGGDPGQLDVPIGDAVSFPFSFGVRAAGAARVRVTASALDAGGGLVVRRSASAPFVRGETRRLVIQLERSCEGLTECGAGLTCRAGGCESEDVGASELEPVAPGSELGSLPPFGARDAGPPDAGDEPDAGPECAPACDADESCGAGGVCRCGGAAACGDASRCVAGACVPWPRSCDDVAPGRGCDVVSLPGGVMTMGDRDAFQEGRASATPLQTGIRVSPFRLDAYEVTVARFRRYWEAGHPAIAELAYPGGRTLVVAGTPAEPLTIDANDETCTWTPAPDAHEEHPINCISWPTAIAFCAWEGGRLPTEAELEWASRGAPIAGLTPGRAYPWGDEEPLGAPCDRAHAFACMGDDGLRTRRVGSFAPTGGLYDLAGNVFELSADLFQVYQFMGDPPSPACWEGATQVDPLCLLGGPMRAQRGGGWSALAITLRGASRRDISETLAIAQTGLRCAYGAAP